MIAKAIRRCVARRRARAEYPSVCPLNGITRQAHPETGAPGSWHPMDANADYRSRFTAFRVPGSQRAQGVHREQNYALADEIRDQRPWVRVFFYEEFDQKIINDSTRASWAEHDLSVEAPWTGRANARDSEHFLPWGAGQDRLRAQGFAFDPMTEFEDSPTSLPYNVGFRDGRVRCQHTIYRLSDPDWRAHRFDFAARYARSFDLPNVGIVLRRDGKAPSYVADEHQARPLPDERGQGWISNWLLRGETPADTELWREGHWAPADENLGSWLRGMFAISRLRGRYPDVQFWGAIWPVWFTGERIAELRETGEEASTYAALVDHCARCDLIDIGPNLDLLPHFAVALEIVESNARKRRTYLRPFAIDNA